MECARDANVLCNAGKRSVCILYIGWLVKQNLLYLIIHLTTCITQSYSKIKHNSTKKHATICIRTCTDPTMWCPGPGNRPTERPRSRLDCRRTWALRPPGIASPRPDRPQTVWLLLGWRTLSVGDECVSVNYDVNVLMGNAIVVILIARCLLQNGSSRADTFWCKILGGWFYSSKPKKKKHKLQIQLRRVFAK